MGLLRQLHRAFGDRATRDADAFAAQRRLVTRATPTIFDIGAHLGETARRYRLLYPQAVIHCFEPFKASFDTLQAALAADALLHAHQLAVGAAPGRASLHVNRSKATNSLLASDARAATYWGQNLLDTDETVGVPVTSLDAFCQEHSLERIDILKLDVQGAEFDVLTGAKRLLDDQAIDVVYMEMITAPTYVGQHDLHEYLGLFRSHGYVLFDFYNPVRKNGRLLQTDNIMVAERFLAAHERGPAGPQ
jgi:FkbM family methyltransferase